MNIKMILIVFFLISCGKKDENTIIGPSAGRSYAYKICEQRLGLKNYEIVNGANIDFECVDGSRLYIKNYYLP